MHLLPCPSCQASIPTPPSQAGERTRCHECGATVDVPKLGELRRLPRVSEPSDTEGGVRETSTPMRIGFLVLGLIAIASLLVAGFCGIRWVLIDVPMTTQQHIEEIQQQYQTISAAELIREYEQMEEYGLELGSPYRYKQLQIKKDAWGRSAAIAAVVGVLAILGAIAVAVSGRNVTPTGQDT